MSETNTHEPMPGFSAVEMKRELQAEFQRKTTGMSFEELRAFLDQSLPPLPQEAREDALVGIAK